MVRTHRSSGGASLSLRNGMDSLFAWATVLGVAVVLVGTAGAVAGGDAGESAAGKPATGGLTYQSPPKAMADLVDAPATPRISVSPTHEWIVLMERPNLPPISEVSQPELRLAGVRINPRTNGRSRTRPSTNLTLKRMSDGKDFPIAGLPNQPRIGGVSWSPDGARFAFTLTRERGIELWVGEVSSRQVKRVTEARVNATYGSTFQWLSDSAALIVKMIPESRGAVPVENIVPAGPVVQENIGKIAPARTYQDLLKSAHDEALFDHYFTARVVRVSVDGQATPLVDSGVIVRCEPSPSGKYLLAETLHKPYSYLVPASRFPRTFDVLDAGGKLVHRIADIPLAEEIPIGFSAVRTGPRSIGWRADSDATLYWAEAQDGGDPRKKTDIRDRVFTLGAPFDGDQELLVSLGLRYGGITWGNDRLALVSEWWWQTRKVRTSIVNPSTPGSEARVLFDRSWEDRYNDPGNPMTVRTPSGQRVLLTRNDGKTLFLTGTGASPEGNRPFIDRLSLASKETSRLWRSEAPYYESVVDFLDVDRQIVLSRRESKTDPANYFTRDLSDGTLRQITDFPHPTPQLADVQKEMIRYERADGVKLTGTLYLPPGYKKSDGALPVLMWAYPQEFKSADAAGQVTDSPYRFVRVGWWGALPWLTQGYAVLDDPSLPIVGEDDVEPNDTFREQLVSGAKAAVDELVRRGVGDRNRMAIAGHSYGAFMTANLLAHSDLFRAGIARSGAYNRTLTPFGFQSEERTFWEAPEVYFTMSPFMHAEKVDEPILMIHGQADNNSGTFPMQSERYYNALKGHGATARLVMLPHESHGYRARESVLHTLWEMNQWLDKYVKHAAPREASDSKPVTPKSTSS